MNDKSKQSLDGATFQRIQKWYLYALSGIALTIIIAQILIQAHLNSQLDDSRIINVAGRQRAYSQKLVKESLLLKDAKTAKEKTQLKIELQKTLQIWEDSHRALQFGDATLSIPEEDNPEIWKLFKEITPHHTAMVNAVKDLLQQLEINTNIGEKRFNENVAILLQNERTFLKLMDTIVNEYDERSKKQLQNLQYKEYLLLAFSLLILLLEVLFIFKPLSIQIRETIKKLVESKQKSENNALEIEKLYDEKERSLKELQELNFVIDNAALFASVKKDGSVAFISRKFLDLLGHTTTSVTKPLSEILTVDEGQQQYLNEILKSKRTSIRTEEIKIRTINEQDLWLDMSIIPMHQSSLKQSVLLLCSDITARKENQFKVEQLTKERYEESIKQKQIQASQIVEGQEEERKRIAKDIHDGIGQMLTALKFNIESIDVADSEKTKEKISYLKELTADLIKGVRTATFNLTPPELIHHGVFPALHKMSVELSRLTGKKILFQNKATENIRFNSLAETNVYRVTQEAVNNAIKYAEANYILITINYSEGILSVVIDDDGKGFDNSILKKRPESNSEGGMGLFFMKERISYINGRLFINSAIGKGTRITINYKTQEELIEYGEE